MAQAITALKVEVEFTAGTWTDITQWVDFSAGGSLRIGRATQWETPSPGTFSVTLDNTDGRFTPMRQTLNDGTAHPYYPNVLPRRRVRYSWVVGASTYPQFIGYIVGWPPTYKDGRKPRMLLEARDRLFQLQSLQLRTPLEQEISGLAPRYYWPMTDSSDGLAAAEYYGGPSLTEVAARTWPAGVASPNSLGWGADGPGSGNGTAVSFSPTPSSSPDNYDYLQGALSLAVTAFTVELWIKPGTSMPAWIGGAGGNYIVPFWMSDGTPNGICELSLLDTTQLAFTFSSGGVSGGASKTSSGVLDGRWHHVALTVTSTGTTRLYVDSSSSGTTAVNAAISAVWRQVMLGTETGYASSSTAYRGSIAQVVVYDYALTAAQIATRYQAGTGWTGELASDRVSRLLTLGGVPAGERVIDTSAVLLRSYPQGDATDGQAIQAVVDSEGGGSVFYIRGDGASRFTTRTQRLPATPTLVVDAVGDLDVNTYEPAYDADGLVNRITGNRMTAAGTATTQTVTDTNSVATYQALDGSFESYAQTDTDVLYNAQDRLVRQSTPTLRFNQLTVDLMTPQSTGLALQCVNTEIGSRVQVQNLDVTAAPTPTLTLHAEGWTDSFSDITYTRTYDTSAADSPAPGIWAAVTGGDPTYGRWQCNGQQLNAAITNTATSLAIKSPAGGATFTTDTAQYPLTIVVGQEHIRLNTAPGGTASPQTFTGVTRGVDGTTPAAQAINSGVDLYPTSTWTL